MMSIRQVDSAFKFAESVKTLRDLKRAADSTLVIERQKLQIQKELREKDKADYKIIIDGYAAIETSQRLEIQGLNRKYRGQVRKNRILFILFVAAGSWGVYQTIK